MGNQPAAPGIPQPRNPEPEAGAANEQAGDSNDAASPSSNMTYTIQNPLNLRKTSIDLVRRSVQALPDLHPIVDPVSMGIAATPRQCDTSIGTGRAQQ